MWIDLEAPGVAREAIRSYRRRTSPPPRGSRGGGLRPPPGRFRGGARARQQHRPTDALSRGNPVGIGWINGGERGDRREGGVFGPLPRCSIPFVPKLSI